MSDRGNPTWQHSSNSGDKEVQLWRAIDYNGERIDALQLDMRETVTQAVKDAMPNALLNADEHRWVQLAIKREAQTIAFRQPRESAISILTIRWTGLLQRRWACAQCRLLSELFMTAALWA